ncbi:MAG: hypothetical protein WBG30_03885 [Psychrilyobacter sp.]|uniref:hypothetical protein n=1 Tax=Psychrilyobacter sp. TaxID=2586924 RepID=UPI003C7494D6
MNIKLTIILVLALYLIIGVISPTIRNYFKFKEGEELEKNIGGFIIKKLYKK